MPSVRNAAIIEINSQILLDMLDFKDGQIHDIRMPKDIWKPNFVEIVIEHPDLPEVRPQDHLLRIEPMYRQVYEKQQAVMIRVEPKKQSK